MIIILLGEGRLPGAGDDHRRVLWAAAHETSRCVATVCLQRRDQRSSGGAQLADAYISANNQITNRSRIYGGENLIHISVYSEREVWLKKIMSKRQYLRSCLADCTLITWSGLRYTVNFHLEALWSVFYFFATMLSLLKIVVSFVQVVRDSALLALAQFADYLQPDISGYHHQLLPIIFTYLTQVRYSLLAMLTTVTQESCCRPTHESDTPYLGI